MNPKEPTELYVWFAENEGRQQRGEHFIRAWTGDPSQIPTLQESIGRKPNVYRVASDAAKAPRRDVAQLADWLLTDPQSGAKPRFAGPLERDLLGLSRVRMENERGEAWTLTAGLREGYLTVAERMANIRTAAKEESIDASPTPIGYVEQTALAKLSDPQFASETESHVAFWHAANPPSRALVPLYTAPIAPQAAGDAAQTAIYQVRETRSMHRPWIDTEKGYAEKLASEGRHEMRIVYAAPVAHQATGDAAQAPLAWIIGGDWVTNHKGVMEGQEKRGASVTPLYAAPVAPAAVAPITEAQRKAIDDAARVLGENWEHETADRLTEAFVASGASAAATSESADWRGDFERKATVSGFDLSREEAGGDYCHDRPAAAWLWYYSGRLDQACAAPTPTVAADAAAPSEHCKLCEQAYDPACQECHTSNMATRLTEQREVIQALQKALAYWMPKVFDDRSAHDAYLLVGYDGEDEVGYWDQHAATQPDERAAFDKHVADLVRAYGRACHRSMSATEMNNAFDAVIAGIQVRAAAPQANHAEINEIFERQQAGFARCFEALGIGDDDDRERGWSSLVLAINDARAAAPQAGATLTDEQRGIVQSAADTANRVLCAGGDYGDELSDTGLRRDLKAARDALRELLDASSEPRDAN